MTSPFTIKKIREGTHLVTEPFFREHANLYLIEGMDFDLLVDCGLGLFDIKDFLATQGFRPKVVLTHSHFDHVGGVSHFTPEEIFVTKDILDNLRKSESWALEYLKPGFFDADFVRTQKHQTPEDICANYAMNVPPGLAAFSGSHISTGDKNFRILAAPGHTDDAIVLYDETNKILISGDTLYEGEMYDMFKNSNREQFIQSLEVIKALDFEIVLTGHNRVLSREEALRAADVWIAQLQCVMG